MAIRYYAQWVRQADWDERPDDDQADYIDSSKLYSKLEDAEKRAAKESVTHGHADVNSCDPNEYSNHELVSSWMNGEKI